MKNITLFVLVPISLASCKYDVSTTSDLQNGIVKGIVLDKTTDIGIADAVVYLLASEGGEIWGGAGGPSFEIAQTVSDTNGNFTFNFDYDDNYGYYGLAVAQSYFDYGDEVFIDPYTSGGNNVEVKLQPIGFLQLHVKNTSPQNISDHIAVNGVVSFYIYGMNIDSLLIFSVPGNYNNPISWQVTKSGNISTFQTDLYCTPFDTTFYEILY